MTYNRIKKPNRTLNFNSDTDYKIAYILEVFDRPEFDKEYRIIKEFLDEHKSTQIKGEIRQLTNEEVEYLKSSLKNLKTSSN